MYLETVPTGRRRTLTKVSQDEGVCVATVRRMISPGVLSAGGAARRVRLRALKIGGKYFVFDEDWLAFLRELNAGQEAETGSAASDLREVSRSAARAEAAADAIGL